MVFWGFWHISWKSVFCTAAPFPQFPGGSSYLLLGRIRWNLYDKIDNLFQWKDVNWRYLIFIVHQSPLKNLLSVSVKTWKLMILLWKATHVFVQKKYGAKPPAGVAMQLATCGVGWIQTTVYVYFVAPTKTCNSFILRRCAFPAFPHLAALMSPLPLEVKCA